MYVASYNQVSHTTGNYKLGATYRATDYNNTLDYTGYNRMYCEKNSTPGSYYWWLASPSASTSSSVCSVFGYSANLSGCSCGFTSNICPLVSLKSSFQLEIEQ